ncbi:MAG: antitoxin [Acidimicrobiia bacterium]|nr:antitoxin [Acidimicrobiia bacterium]
MRTTVTLDEDVAQAIRQCMRERGAGFKETVNDLLRRGLRGGGEVEAYEGPTFSSGVQPGVNLDKALSLAAALEDEEVVRKIEMRK